MKSFKQFDESHTVALNSAEDDNLGLFNVQDEKVMQRLNGFVGAIAQQEYMQPDAAMKQLQNKLNIVGLNFTEPKIDSDKGNATVELTQFGGRYGKTPEIQMVLCHKVKRLRMAMVFLIKKMVD